MTIHVALAGAGAFGIKHLDAMKNIADVKVVSVVGRDLAKTKEVADKYGIAHVATDLADSLRLKTLDAVILATPTQMHAAQSMACLEAGHRLGRVHLRGRGEDHRVQRLQPQAVGEVGGHVRDAVLVGHLLGLGEVATDHRDHLHVGDVLHRIEMLDAECAGTGQCHVDRHVSSPG